MHQLETDLAKVQLQLLESRKENAYLKQEAFNYRSSDATRPTASQPPDGTTEPESQALRAQTVGLRRQLRNSQKVIYDLIGDRVRGCAHWNFSGC
jgi:hypothetical protein